MAARIRSVNVAVWLFSACCWVGVVVVRGGSDGDAVEACLNPGALSSVPASGIFTPQRRSPIGKGTGGFTINLMNCSIPETVYEFELSGTGSSFFRGFVIQAVDEKMTPTGQFIARHGGQYKLLNCCTSDAATLCTSDPNATITHINNLPKCSVRFSWKPTNISASVDMIYTVVTTINQTNFEPSSSRFNLSAGWQQSKALVPCPEPYLVCPPPSNEFEASFSVSLGEFRGRSYSFMAQPNTNDGRFVDIQLEAQATGWVAIGFSETTTMAEADVLVCVRDAESQDVYVLDMWTPLPNHSPPILNSTQEGLCVNHTSFVDGVISCSFSRYIDAIDKEHDLNLYDKLFQMYGYGDEQVPPRNCSSDSLKSIKKHENTPDVSYYAVSIANSSGVFVIHTIELIRVHGVLMIISWGMMATTAIFMSMWTRPLMPNGKWLEFHWGFMVASALLTAFGFVTIFVANYNNQTTLPGLISFSCGKSITHFVFGLLVVTLQCLNIMVSFCRCNPESPHRWIYNLVHGNVIGLATWILALSNAGIGVAIFEDDRGNVPTSGYKIVWLYVGFLAFLLILNGILLLSFALSARKPGTFEEYLQIAPSIARYFARFKMLNRTVDQNAKKQGIEMSNLVIDEDKKEEIVEVKNMMINSLDTKLRLIGTALLLVVSTILTVTLSGMIVAAKE